MVEGSLPDGQIFELHVEEEMAQGDNTYGLVNSGKWPVQVVRVLQGKRLEDQRQEVLE